MPQHRQRLRGSGGVAFDQSLNYLRLSGRPRGCRRGPGRPARERASDPWPWEV